jgi:hypothetical protein
MNDIIGTTAADEQRDRCGRFIIGGKPGPGRPKGARSRLSERFLDDLAGTWHEHGADVLQRLAQEKPAALLQAMVMLLPKHISLDANIDVSADVSSYAERFRIACDLLHEQQPGMKVIEQRSAGPQR